MGFNKRRFTLKYEKVGEISRRLVVVILMGIGGTSSNPGTGALIKVAFLVLLSLLFSQNVALIFKSEF